MKYPHLPTSNARDAQDLNLLSRIGVTHILNVTDCVPMPFEGDRRFRYLRLPACDNNQQDLRPAFEASVDFIDVVRCAPLSGIHENPSHFTLAFSESPSCYLPGTGITLNPCPPPHLGYSRRNSPILCTWVTNSRLKPLSKSHGHVFATWTTSGKTVSQLAPVSAASILFLSLKPSL
ncbi:unnamed protein product [Protopolystoma xenopodis]|uniref:Protein-serine/threonine phosphatase n=1 Tax=Protopolystoma xenopodis TaxID=117903 RepID=A0A448WIZ0_9PLAT|nr:unnamed protein product [Protopolystoma xenopodis]